MRRLVGHLAVAIVSLTVPRAAAAQGPRLSYLTDPDTELGFASCTLSFVGGSRHRIPFLPVIDGSGAPMGTDRYRRDIRLVAPIEFVGDGVASSPDRDPYAGLDARGKFVLFAYDTPGGDSTPAMPLEDRVREAARRGAAGVVVFSLRAATPFPRFREAAPERIPAIPVIAIDRAAAATILASDGRDPDETLDALERDGRFTPGELIARLELRIVGRFDAIESAHFSFAFQPGIATDRQRALVDVNERAVARVRALFGGLAPHWTKTLTVYFAGYDAKVFYVHHWGEGLSSEAGNFLHFDGRAPALALAAHENAHRLVSENWDGSSSFLVEGIGKYAEAMATDPDANDREARRALDAGLLFPLTEMSEIAIGSDPRTGVAYPAAGSFVRFLVTRHSLAKLREIYQAVARATDAGGRRSAWSAVYGKPLEELDREWLEELRTARARRL